MHKSSFAYARRYRNESIKMYVKNSLSNKLIIHVIKTFFNIMSFLEPILDLFLEVLSKQLCISRL